MRASRCAAALAAACFLWFTGCKPPAPATVPATERSADTTASAGITTTTTDPGAFAAPGSEKAAPTKPTPKPAEAPRPPGPAAQIAELMILEAELRLKRDTTEDGAERQALTRRIEETEQKRLDLYRKLPNTR